MRSIVFASFLPVVTWFTAILAAPTSRHDGTIHTEENGLHDHPFGPGVHVRNWDLTDVLSTREYEELEKRIGGNLERNTGARLAEGLEAVITAVQNRIQKDKDMRSEYTKKLVDRFYHRYRKFNFVVCHTDHKTEFEGKKGYDWGHIHHEVDVGFHKTVGFELYWFRKGVFHRYGDGGYLNWAYFGNTVNTANDGKDVTFAARP